jgi:hypothetical protein
VVLLLFFLLFQAGKPPVSWEDSFDVDENKPYGAEYLEKSLPYIAPNKNLSYTRQSIAQSLKNENLPLSKSAFFILNDDFFPTEIEIEAIKEALQNGNHFFISSYRISDQFMDSLTLDLDDEFIDRKEDSCWVSNKETDAFKVANKSLMFFSKHNNVFSRGKLNKETNWISAPYGKGEIHLHLAPNAFVNYHILKEESIEYLSHVFSIIEPDELIWTSYYNPKMNQKASSPFYVIFQNRSLKAALQFSVFGTLLFMVFGMKRKQRVIPIITPLKNQSLALARSIAALNLKQKNHRENLLLLQQMTKKEIFHTYRISFKHNEDFYHRLSALSGINEAWCSNKMAYFLGFVPGNTLNKSEYKQLFDIYQEFKNKSIR